MTTKFPQDFQNINSKILQLAMKTKRIKVEIVLYRNNVYMIRKLLIKNNQINLSVKTLWDGSERKKGFVKSWTQFTSLRSALA